MDIDLETVQARMAENGLSYAVLDIGSRQRLIVTERWGRCLGPFDAIGRSFMWLNEDVWSSTQQFAKALSEGSWNVGGERFWVAPEIRLNIKDRADFWGSYELPNAMDPGNWKLRSGVQTAQLSTEAKLALYNPRAGTVAYRAERSISPAANPLRNLRAFDELMTGIQYSGYIHKTRLSILPGSDSDARLEAWTLSQLVPAGTIFVPCAEGVEYEDYYEKADESCLRIGDSVTRFEITGKRRYKVGLRSTQLFGRAGYLKATTHEGASASAALLVRSFYNDPSSEYVEEPDSQPGCRGLSFHVYNDGGAFGGFGELECNGRTVGGTAGNEVTDEFSFWLFHGSVERVEAIARALLGSDLSGGRNMARSSICKS